MSFGNSVTVELNGSPYTLNRINQDGYGSEYLLRESTRELRMKIRHSKEGVQPSGSRFDRHNVELTETVYATPTSASIVRQAYIVLRNDYADTSMDVAYLDQALVDFVADGTTIQDLINWEN